MTQNNATIRQSKDGTWEGRVKIKGEKVLLYGKTKAVVKKQVMALLQGEKNPEEIREQKDKKKKESVAFTVTEWLTEWQEKWLPNVSVNALRRYSVDIRLHIVPYIGDISLSMLTPTDVQNMYNAAIASGLSTKSVKCMNSVLHSALDKAIELNLVERNVTESCKLPKLKTNEMHPLKDRAVHEFLSRIKATKYEDAYFIALFTGMRESELLGLTWDCIDFMKGTICVYRQLQRTHVHGEYAFTQTKNGKSRTIAAAKSVMERLAQILRRQNEAEKNPSVSYINSERFVLTDSHGHHLTINSLYKPFKKIVSEMGVGETRFHDLRHSYAVLSLQSGCDIKTLSSNLGHSTITLTLDRYGHVSDTMQKQSSDLLEELIHHL